ncbi:MAG: response regulator [Anaerolineales bacterium]|nr:response regulator [Anaerolineales bacterium]
MSQLTDGVAPTFSMPGDAEQPATGQELAGGAAVRVLVAEDNALSQKVVERMLRSFGCEVDLVATGADAVEAVENQPYQLILMDIRMPVMDGVEATHAIRHHLSQERQPLIYALTAGVSAQERQRCLDVGMNGFLAKPVERTEIAALIESLR